MFYIICGTTLLESDVFIRLRTVLFNWIRYIQRRVNIYDVYFFNKVILMDFKHMTFLIVFLSKKVLLAIPMCMYRLPCSPRTSCMEKQSLTWIVLLKKDPLYVDH
jgi:hypothetical protein